MKIEFGIDYSSDGWLDQYGFLHLTNEYIFIVED